MKFYKNLYVGETIKNPKAIKKKLKYHAKQLKTYVVMLPSGAGQLEICHSMLLEQPFYKKKDNSPYVIGIAGNYDEAVELVCRIAGEAVAQNGNADIKNYLFPESQTAGKA